MNNTVDGNQFWPQIVPLGSSQLVVWSVMGQSTMRNGVNGRLLTLGAIPVGQESRINITTIGQQMHPALASDASGRTLIVWSGFNPATQTFDIFAINDVLKLLVTPIAGGVRLQWPTHPGLQYQIQRSGDLSVWKNVGSTRTAAGYSDTNDIPATVSVTGAAFYRVILVR